MDLIKFNEEIKQHPKSISGHSAWTQHIPFGMFLVNITKPKLLVELGTHYGDAYFSMCQVIKKNNIDTKTFAVDNWGGDEIVSPYGPEVYDYFINVNNYYKSFSTPLKMTFDEALSRFEDNSIDILHIDGYHSYEAVKHDFETWLPKMKENSIILFHDIAVKNTPNFGVWQLWEELKLKYLNFEFSFGYGLGVLVVGKPISDLEELFNSKNIELRQNIHNYFSTLGSKIS